jgi:hypothetical protein
MQPLSEDKGVFACINHKLDDDATETLADIYGQEVLCLAVQREQVSEQSGMPAGSIPGGSKVSFRIRMNVCRRIYLILRHPLNIAVL